MNPMFLTCPLGSDQNKLPYGPLSKLAMANAAVLPTFDEGISGSYLIPK
jgi:hypothetical protein